MSKLLAVLSLVMILILGQSVLAPTEAWSVPTGACCFPDGSCMDDMVQAECEGQGGTYMGHGITCDEVECVPQPQGACCYSDGSCSDDLTQAECEGEGGIYMGDGTTCAEVDCGAAIPTLTEWGLIIFGVVLIGFITWVFLKRRKAAVSYQ